VKDILKWIIKKQGVDGNEMAQGRIPNPTKKIMEK
jgi:hypothetical protein